MHNPSYYARRFQDFVGRDVFKKEKGTCKDCLIPYGTVSFPGLVPFGTVSFPGLVPFGTVSFPGLVPFGTVSFPGLVPFGTVSFPGLVPFGIVSFPGLVPRPSFTPDLSCSSSDVFVTSGIL